MLVVLFSLSALPGCRDASQAESAPDKPNGAGPAQRIAVLSPAMAIIIRDLGQGDRIVARHGWDMATDVEIPVAGDQRGIDYEVLLGTGPDLILLESGAEPVPSRLRELANRNEWRIVRLPMLTLADIRSAVLELDQLTAPAAPSARALELVEAFDESLRPQPGVPSHAGRVVMIVSADPPGVLGPGSFHYEIGHAMGLDMEPLDGAPFINMSAEELRALNPDTVVFIVPGAADEQSSTMLEPLASLGMRAVERGGIILVTDAESLTPSTAMIRFAQDLRSQFEALPVLGD